MTTLQSPNSPNLGAGHCTNTKGTDGEEFQTSTLVLWLRWIYKSGGQSLTATHIQYLSNSLEGYKAVNIWAFLLGVFLPICEWFNMIPLYPKFISIGRHFYTKDFFIQYFVKSWSKISQKVWVCNFYNNCWFQTILQFIYFQFYICITKFLA